MSENSPEEEAAFAQGFSIGLERGKQAERERILDALREFGRGYLSTEYLRQVLDERQE